MTSENTNAKLPLHALREIPEPKSNASTITGLVKEGGKVSGYQLSDGRIVSKEDGVMLARQGEIRGVGIASRKGNEYLKSIPDETENNNLSNLPSITQ